jgi:DNA-binding NtrC family response regulator
MICDDENDILLTYAAILENNYSVITTSSGRQCVETYARRKKNGEAIHLILLDFKLPDMTGDQVAKEIMLLNGTSIVLISAYQLDSKWIEELKRNKLIVEFLSKPVSVSSLRETVDRAISD